MMRRLQVRLIPLLLFVLVISPFASAQEAPLGGLDDYVNRALRDWEVPGVAIAIVKDDRTVLAKGYGVRKLGDLTPTSERTLFAIGSSSKAFTAASVAMLVDEGKLKWDEAATKYLPGFELYDPHVTRELTVRDLLSHPATNLELDHRGFLKEGMFADVVVFDPRTIADRATFEKPHQYAVGVQHFFVNGVQVLRDGEHTNAKPGQALWGPGKIR
ncbi:MAG: serine hydrolase [Pyrinomonadaceae bacterium]|nr:serine hydrolase [Pyrinomonadaceae bacterium]